MRDISTLGCIAEEYDLSNVKYEEDFRTDDEIEGEMLTDDLLMRLLSSELGVNTFANLSLFATACAIALKLDDESVSLGAAIEEALDESSCGYFSRDVIGELVERNTATSGCYYRRVVGIFEALQQLMDATDRGTPWGRGDEAMFIPYIGGYPSNAE